MACECKNKTNGDEFKFCTQGKVQHPVERSKVTVTGLIKHTGTNVSCTGGSVNKYHLDTLTDLTVQMQAELRHTHS